MRIYLVSADIVFTECLHEGCTIGSPVPVRKVDHGRQFRIVKADSEADARDKFENHWEDKDVLGSHFYLVSGIDVSEMIE